MTIQQFIINIEPSYKKLVDNNEKKVQALQRFNEFLIRLELRFNSLLDVENEIFSMVDPNHLKRKLSDIQLDLVDKIESFYQQIYATLSAFVMLISHVASRDFKIDMPISNMHKFLTFLQERFSEIQKEIDCLEVAIDFRAKFIDHIQQHVLHDWMTYSYPNKLGTDCVIIYFVRGKSETHYQNFQKDPYDINFRPPISCKHFYVSPPHKDTFMAFQGIIKTVITKISDNL